MRIKVKNEGISKDLQDKYQKIKEEITLSAMLYSVYIHKRSIQIMKRKVNHQFNAMEVMIHQINPKFQEKSKNYRTIKEEMIASLDAYEKVLKQLAEKYNQTLKEMMFRKVELETKLLMASLEKQQICLKKEKNKKFFSKEKAKDKDEHTEEVKENRKFIIQLEKDIKQLNTKMQNLEQEKDNQLFQAMEVGGKELTVNLKKPRKISKITTFFSNRFNTYHVIVKSIINPLNQRIDEFKVNELKKVDGTIKEFDFIAIQDKIKEIQDNVLEEFQNKLICKSLNIKNK